MVQTKASEMGRRIRRTVNRPNRQPGRVQPGRVELTAAEEESQRRICSWPKVSVAACVKEGDVCYLCRPASIMRACVVASEKKKRHADDFQSAIDVIDVS